MMQHIHRGTLTLLLVTGIALVMLLSFGFRAVQVAQNSQASSLACRYTHMIMTAKASVEP